MRGDRRTSRARRGPADWPRAAKRPCDLPETEPPDVWAWPAEYPKAAEFSVRNPRSLSMRRNSSTNGEKFVFSQHARGLLGGIQQPRHQSFIGGNLMTFQPEKHVGS